MNTTIDTDTTVGDLIARHPEVRSVLDDFHMDYCCRGDRSLAEAARVAGVDLDPVRRALQEAIDLPAEGHEPHENWLEASLTRLIDHIERRHHTYMKTNLPRLRNLAAKVLEVHGPRHGDVLRPLLETFDGLKAEIEEHLFKEERILFPVVRQFEAHAGGGPEPVFHCGSIDNPIRQMRHEHENAGAALERMRRLTSDYRVPDDACESFRALYEGLEALEDDLHQHIHLENNILFPKAGERYGEPA
jgi:regulator of cell morphogenesis and NO signaling